MQEGFPFYLMIGIRYTVTAAAAAHCNHTRYDIFIEFDATIGLGLRWHTAEADMTLLQRLKQGIGLSNMVASTTEVTRRRMAEF